MNIQIGSHAEVGRSLTDSGIADFLAHTICDLTIQPLSAMPMANRSGISNSDFGLPYSVFAFTKPCRRAWSP